MKKEKALYRERGIKKWRKGRERGIKKWRKERERWIKKWRKGRGSAREKGEKDEKEREKKRKKVAMKVKRQKQNKKILSVFVNSFGFRNPFQVILDGTFIQVARMSGMNIEKCLENQLTNVRLFTTYCVYAELKKLGPDFRPSAAFAKKLERRRCTHKIAVSATECIKSIIGQSNEFNYCVATQDLDLRIHLREIPGVPLIYINKSAMILEPCSEKTLEKSREISVLKTVSSLSSLGHGVSGTGLSGKGHAVSGTGLSATGHGVSVTGITAMGIPGMGIPEPTDKKGPRKRKQPNPLSVKKKQKKKRARK